MPTEYTYTRSLQITEGSTLKEFIPGKCPVYVYVWVHIDGYVVPEDIRICIYVYYMYKPVWNGDNPLIISCAVWDEITLLFYQYVLRMGITLSLHQQVLYGDFMLYKYDLSMIL